MINCMFISNALYNGVKAIFAFSSAKIDKSFKIIII